MSEAHIYRQKLALLLLDILAFLTAFVVAMHLRFDANLGVFEYGRPPWEPMLQSLPVMLGVWLGTLWVSGLYRVERNRLFLEFGGIVQSLIVMAGILLSLTFFYRGFSYSRGFAMLFMPFLLTLSFFGRIAFRVVRAQIAGLDRGRNRVLLVGASPVAKHFADSMGTPGFRFDIAGLLDDELPLGAEVGNGVAVVGRTSQLTAVATELGARGIVVTNPRLEEATQLNLLEVCLGQNLEWQVVPSAYELMLDRVQLDAAAGVPLLGMRRCNIRGANRLVKRAFDILAASCALVLLSPVMLAVALLIKLTSKGPVLFTQVRVGENGKPFSFLKFRSMHVNNDDSIHREYTRAFITQGVAHAVDEAGALYKIKDDPRLIPIGKFIRKYSIDELPQLFNVIRGEMSLIGPRPPIPYEVEVYREWHKRRFEGPPGITGLWQVSGRNRLSFEEMVKLDIEYLENWSLWRDLKILWRTMGVVLFDRAY